MTSKEDRLKPATASLSVSDLLAAQVGTTSKSTARRGWVRVEKTDLFCIESIEPPHRFDPPVLGAYLHDRHLLGHIPYS